MTEYKIAELEEDVSMLKAKDVIVPDKKTEIVDDLAYISTRLADYIAFKSEVPKNTALCGADEDRLSGRIFKMTKSGLYLKALELDEYIQLPNKYQAIGWLATLKFEQSGSEAGTLEYPFGVVYKEESERKRFFRFGPYQDIGNKMRFGELRHPEIKRAVKRYISSTTKPAGSRGTRTPKNVPSSSGTGERN